MIAGEGFREDARLHRLDYSHLWPSSWLLKLSKRDRRLRRCLLWVHSPLASGWDARSSYEIWRAESNSWLSIRKQELAITTSLPDILRYLLSYTCSMNWGVAVGHHLGALIPRLLTCANNCLSLQIYRGSKCQGSVSSLALVSVQLNNQNKPQKDQFFFCFFPGID